MGWHKVGAFRLLCSSVICVLIGLPLGGYGALQSFMLQRHIYENRCTVSFGASPVAGVNDGLVCAESRAAYVNLFTSSSIAYAIAMVPAYFALKYVGYLFSSICCALLLAAGSVVLTEPNNDRWGHDKYALGLSLLASAAPFALLNNLGAITTTTTSPRLVLAWAVFSMVGIQLSPLLWRILEWYTAAEGKTTDAFQEYLWIPCCALVMVLLLMPFPDIHPHASHFRELLTASEKSIIPATADSTSNLELVPLLNQCEATEGPITNTSFLDHVPFQLFVIELLSYLAHALPLDLMLISGQIRATDQVDISYLLSVVSPALAAGVVPLLLGLSAVSTLTTVHLLTAILCVANFALQLAHTPLTLQIAATSVGSCRLFLSWFLISCSLRCLGVQAYFLLTIVFLCGAIIEWAILPSIDHSFVFGVPLLGHNPFLLGVGFQIVATLLTIRFLRNKSHMARRCALDQEARLAFEQS